MTFYVCNCFYIVFRHTLFLWLNLTKTGGLIKCKSSFWDSTCIAGSIFRTMRKYFKVFAWSLGKFQNFEKKKKRNVYRNR